MFYVYMLRCKDNSIYTGYTTNIKRRYSEHLGKYKRGAKYTHSRIPVSIAALWETDSKSSAMKLEYFIKKLSKQQKEELIINNDLVSTKYEERLYGNVYEPVDYEDC